MKRLEVTIYGRVQGVSFRYYTRLEANHLGLVGWVKNVPNGSVRVLAEGETGQLEQFLTFLRRGSPAARVDDVAITWSEATQDYKSFGVRY